MPSSMSDPETALGALAEAVQHPLAFDHTGECGIEFEGARLVVLHRRDQATLSIRLPLLRIDTIADTDTRLAVLEQALAANYQSLPGLGTVGLCENSRSLVLVCWLAGEQINDTVETVARLIDQAQDIETKLAEGKGATAGGTPGVGIRV